MSAAMFKNKTHHLVFGHFLAALLFTMDVEAISVPAIKPPSINNFALGESQQPGPFFSFGQNIINKNQLQFFLETNYLSSTTQNLLTVVPAFLYGITDNASILVNIPVAANYSAQDSRSSGIADASIQGEYAFYNANNAKASKQATVVAAISAPTGSLKKNPPTGFGAPSYFLGTTYNEMFVDWWWFASPGVLLIEASDNAHLDTQYWYQTGLGKNLYSASNRYIFSALLELDGQYSEKDKIFGQYDPNSGGNIVYITPSVWFSTQKFTAQLGISIPITQHWNGEQGTTHYYAALLLGWTFN
ncbi:hypothetical protein [Legionella septentrionalis]|uniref:hypothetical protein n=2 Tax=Legionella septentrionalis TaxID=2498109 RepID=UPI001F2C6525|nr:hypothetical protein [Legionella septentrionalis]